MDADDPIEARNTRLLALRTTDPVAWAICQGRRGGRSIAEFLELDRDEVQAALDRLVKDKEVKRVTFKRSYAYRPHSRELKRLARRAYALRKENKN
jgi:hypothetical protein